MPKARGHSWLFKARFRRHAFGWKSQPAIARLHEAVSEIALVARIDPVLGAEGAVVLLERLSPAREHVDSSSGAIGTAVNHAIAQLVGVVIAAPADRETRAAWLERLFDAHAADQIPYIERLADSWGELCGPAEVASEWADRLIGITRLALSPDKNVRGYFHGTTACLSALFAAGRYAELIEVGTQRHLLAVQAVGGAGNGGARTRRKTQSRTPRAAAARGRTTRTSTGCASRSSSRSVVVRRPTLATGYRPTGRARTSRGFAPSAALTPSGRRPLSSLTWLATRRATRASGSRRRRARSCSRRRLCWPIRRPAIRRP